jgi:outer membrane lipoprotein-sorting protein
MLVKKKTIAIFAALGIVTSVTGIGFSITNTDSVKAAVSQIDVTKEQIQNKMVNSIDYLDTVKGSFTYHADHNNTHYTVDYQVKLGENPSSNTKLKTDEKDRDMKFDGENLLILDNKNKKYEQFKIDKNDLKTNLKGTSAKDRYKKDSSGKVEGVILRRDPSFMGIASDTIFNQNVALGFLEDYSKWDIVGEETYMGLNAVVIKGELNNYYQQKHGAKTFKIWVHKETGILLNMEEYDSNNKIVYYIRTDNIKINGTLDNEKFKTDVPVGYTKK